MAHDGLHPSQRPPLQPAGSVGHFTESAVLSLVTARVVGRTFVHCLVTPLFTFSAQLAMAAAVCYLVCCKYSNSTCHCVPVISRNLHLPFGFVCGLFYHANGKISRNQMSLFFFPLVTSQLPVFKSRGSPYFLCFFCNSPLPFFPASGNVCKKPDGRAHQLIPDPKME